MFKSFANHLITMLIFFNINFVYANNITTESPNYHKNQFYIGVGLGAGINYFAPTNTSISVADAAHASFSWRLFTGYNLNKNLAFEIGYTNFGFYQNAATDNSICDTSGICGYPQAAPFDGVFNTQINVVNKIQSYALDFSVIGRYNILSGSNLFGRLGVNYMNSSLTTDTTVSPFLGNGVSAVGPTVNQSLTATNSNYIKPLIGVGYEYNPNQLVGLRLEYSYYFGSEMVDQNGINQGKLYPSTVLISMVLNL